MDASDPTGNTAYITIMGFHVSHVWMTTNAGVSWSDFTANLLDAPANAVLVDSGVVYVATDVGLFSSRTTDANWIEVGPSADPTHTGYLPDVPVTALRMFNSEGTKKLRASTYGRGIWEATLIAGPDFEFAVPNNSLTVFAGQTATFTGTVTALNSYNSSVNLGCVMGATAPPAACSVTPQSPTPSTSGTAIAVNTSGTAGDYFFSVQGVGADPIQVTRDFSLALHVMDFNLTAPAPGSVSVLQGATSAPVSFQVTATGPFSGSVVLSCSGLPAAAACNFQPSATVNPIAGAPVSVTLTISTRAATPKGTSLITLNGAVTGAPSKTQSLSLNITSPTQGDFVLAISNSPLTVGVTGSAIFKGTLTSTAGYSSVVTLGCGGAAPPTCQVSTPSLMPTTSGAAFTVAVGSESVQDFNFSIAGTGSDVVHTTHSVAVALNVIFDFALNNNTGAQTIQAGQPLTYQLDVRPLGSGNTFPGIVILTCSNLPALTTCSFTPSQIASGSGDSNAVVIVKTAPATSAAVRMATGLRVALYALGLGLPALFVFALRHPARGVRAGKSARATLAVMTLVALATLEVSCGGGLQGGGGGGGNSGTPPGSYTITLTATMTAGSNTLTRTAAAALTVE